MKWEIETRDAAGAGGPTLRVWTRRLVDDDALTLLEGLTYGFKLDVAEDVDWYPPRHMAVLDPTGHSGLLHTREEVGTLILEARGRTSGIAWSAELDIRPRKLSETAYEELWRAVSSHAAEATVHGFAPAFARLGTGDAPAQLRYVRVAQIAAILGAPESRAALEHVVARPHRDWSPVDEALPPGYPVPLGGALPRALARPGPRTKRNQQWVPSRLSRVVAEPTYDTIPNRFARWVLEHWLGDVELLARAHGADARVGQLTIGRIRDRLTEYLARDPFRSARVPTMPPALTNLVLQRRDGYRQIVEAYFRVELAPALAPSLEDPAVLVSQRNIATLYELWCCLSLIKIISKVVQTTPAAPYLVANADGTGLVLKAGDSPAARWTVARWSRPLEVELYYNRSFDPSDDPFTSHTSWTQQMRPDVSLRIAPKGEPSGVWVHFDAKYRLGDLASNDLATLLDEAYDDEAAATPRQVVRADLLKMHAYRDAIRDSVAAYVRVCCRSR